MTEIWPLLVMAACVLLGAIWLLMRFVQPEPPSRLVIATGGTSGAYYGFGKRYAEVLARSGVQLEVRSTAGSLENLRILKDRTASIDLALLQGGIAGQGDSPAIVSLGRAFLEPLWVFYRGDAPIDMLHQLRGRRIAVGPEGSGTRHLAMALLAANELDAGTATLLPVTGQAAAAALVAGEVDAVLLAMAPESALVQSLMRTDGVRLMSFAQADAYARRLPYLQRIVLPRGAFDLVRNVPDRDVILLAPVAAVVAREGLHPALAGLMIDAMREVHGKGGLFHRFGEFPQPVDPELELAEDVERYYKSGASLLKRWLPFWVATFIERMIVLAVPLAGLMIPVAKGVPWLYKWRIKRRLLHWYARLKVLEAKVSADPGGSDIDNQRREIERIDHAVSTIPVPLGFSEEYYNLRSAIDLVRQRLLSHAARVHPNLT
ncbi:MAG: TAXI family TRAP transporter solute-binding subunit [Reyranellaceae bacterium]